jgi:hypothetical protein
MPILKKHTYSSREHTVVFFINASSYEPRVAKAASFIKNPTWLKNSDAYGMNLRSIPRANNADRMRR